MTSIEAMNEVNGFLNDGNIVGAQAAVVAIEANGSVLPSSTFGRVLRAAAEQDAVLPLYRKFCRDMFGSEVYQQILER